MLTAVDEAFVGLSGRLEVTGDVPADLRGRPLLLASNHIGNLDPFVLIAACRRIGVAPRFLLAGGLLDAPIMGPALRASGHLRVDRAAAEAQLRVLKKSWDLSRERRASLVASFREQQAKALEQFRAAAESGDADQAKTLAAAAGRQLDKAASKGVIHKNQAANRKSAMAKKAASL